MFSRVAGMNRGAQRAVDLPAGMAPTLWLAWFSPEVHKSHDFSFRQNTGQVIPHILDAQGTPDGAG